MESDLGRPAGGQAREGTAPRGQPAALRPPCRWAEAQGSGPEARFPVRTSGQSSSVGAVRCRGRASWGAGTGGRRPIGFQVAEPPASSKKEEKRIRRGFSPLPIHDDFSFFFFFVNNSGGQL